jgi:hypothetical protein
MSREHDTKRMRQSHSRIVRLDGEPVLDCPDCRQNGLCDCPLENAFAVYAQGSR